MKNELILTVTNAAPGPFSGDTSAADGLPIGCTYPQVSVRACEVAYRYSRTVRGLAESYLDIWQIVSGGDPR